MNVVPTALPGVLVIDRRVLRDERGYFFESWNERDYAAAGIGERFVQDNVSYSTHGVLRGLHFQHPNAQGKLVSALAGTVFDVAVDVRRGSPTFGQWVGTELSAANHRQMYIPAGFAHGFQVLSADALFAYKCTEYYAAGTDRAVRWNDPAIGIAWPIAEPVLSARDAAAPLLADCDDGQLPAWR